MNGNTSTVLSPQPAPPLPPSTPPPSSPRTPVFHKKKFRTVLGFGSLDSRPRSPATTTVLSDLDDEQPVLISTHTGRQPSITDASSFFNPPPAADQQQQQPSNASTRSSLDVEEMKIDLSAVPPPPPPTKFDERKSTGKLLARSNSKPNFRLAAQWGPWTVSVAETPSDTKNYNVYVKTPTHNYTLTRNHKEIVELHTKLRDSFPTAALPAFPLSSTIPPSPGTPGGKRRSSFLHTLSRFANNTSGRPNTAHGSSQPSPPAATTEQDPFNANAAANTSSLDVAGTGVSATTQLAAYLTSVANDQKLRNARPWKRFMRVRTDDLESVRVERAIKRVRSDLAMHTSPSSFAAAAGRLGDVMGGISDLGAGSLGLSAEGGFPEEQAPSKTASDVKHEKEDTEKAVAPPPLQDKRVSSIMTTTVAGAAASAFSSDSGVRDGAGSAPPTPTPANAVLAPADVALPPSPAVEENLTTPIKEQPVDNQEEAATGLPTPLHSASKIPRSKSADPTPRFHQPQREASAGGESTSFDAGEGDTSVVEESAAEGGVTTDSGRPARPKKRTKTKKAPTKKVTVDDFDMMRVLGKGCAGKVLLVKYKKTGDLYALKAITKRHVLAHQELQHTLTEQAVLKRMARENKDPFVVRLWWSFHDKDNLFLVMDFHPGGDLATQLARWGRLGRDRARFYAAEIVEGVDGLHAAGVIYRDLKPENILIGADGHIVLTDFGLSKEFPRRTASGGALPAAATTSAGTPNGSFGNGGDYYSNPATSGSTPATPHWMAGGSESDFTSGGGHGRDVTSTFCGTAEYLAPEVIQGLPYSYEVDWWSFGTMLYEMLSGITPFWANNHSDMYVRVLQDELQFPDDRAMDQDTKSLIRGLLQRNPALRMSEPRIKRHPYFSMIDWDHVYYKRYIPPYIPPIDPSNASDTQNFDETFLEMQPTIENEDHEPEESEREGGGAATEGEDNNATGPDATPDKSSTPIAPTELSDAFDGYSFKGRHSVLIEDEDDEGYEGEEDDADNEELVEAKKITDALAAAAEERDHTQDKDKDDDAVSEAGTIEQPNREQQQEQDLMQAAVSITPSTSTTTAPESAVMASISSEAESVAAAAPHQQASTDSTTVPPLTMATTTNSTSTPDFAESPIADPDSPIAKAIAAANAYIAAEDAPLPLSPVIEAPHPVDGGSPSTPVQKRVAAGLAAAGSVGVGIVGKDKDKDDDDWDLIEAPHGEERNGAKGPSLWQRGVVDRYRLAVFRNKSDKDKDKPSRASRYDDTTSTSESKRRGRTGGGISLRKSTREFLRAKSPSAAGFSSTSRASLAAQPTTLTVNSAGLLTPSPSAGPSSSKRNHHNVPSLKSKSSAISKGSYGSPPSSDQSQTDLRGAGVHGQQSQQPETPIRTPMSPVMRSSPAGGGDERQSNLKKMKKFGEQGAEKMLSLFGSPRHHQQQQQQQ